MVFGDIDHAGCERLVRELKTDYPQATGTVIFRRVDVRSYDDNLALFRAAYEKHRHVDHALSIAGVTEGENWFDATLDLETVERQPSTAVLDINLLGALYFSRIAAVYLRQGNDSKNDKSLLLTGSLAAFKEQAGLFVYSPAKHGVMGLFRSIRRNLYCLHGIRVNILCPSLIRTAMASKVEHIWEERGLPINTAKEVGDVAINFTALPKQKDGEIHTNLAVYVEGGKAWEFESVLHELDNQWLSENMSKNCKAIDDALGVGSGWTTEKPSN